MRLDRLGVNRIDSCNFELCSQRQLCILSIIIQRFSRMGWAAMSNKMPGCHLANVWRSRSKHILQWRYYTAMKYQFMHACMTTSPVPWWPNNGEGQWPSGRVDSSEPGGPGFHSSSRQPQIVAHRHCMITLNYCVTLPHCIKNKLSLRKILLVPLLYWYHCFAI